MKFVKYLQEKYAARDGKFEIFANPTPKEIKTAATLSKHYSEVRFVADSKTKDLYVANVNFIHPEILQTLRKNDIITTAGNWERDGRFWMGVGELEGGKIKIFSGSADYDNPSLENFTWAKHYFTNFDEWKERWSSDNQDII